MRGSFGWPQAGGWEVMKQITAKHGRAEASPGAFERQAIVPKRMPRVPPRAPHHHASSKRNCARGGSWQSRASAHAGRGDAKGCVRAAKSRPDDRRLSIGGRRRQCAARSARHSAQSSRHNARAATQPHTSTQEQRVARQWRRACTALGHAPAEATTPTVGT